MVRVPAGPGAVVQVAATVIAASWGSGTDARPAVTASVRGPAPESTVTTASAGAKARVTCSAPGLSIMVIECPGGMAPTAVIVAGCGPAVVPPWPAVRDGAVRIRTKSASRD